MRILIADDDVVLRRALHARLALWRYDVVTCADGSEALQELRAPSPPQIAILDWHMPGADGLSICREVRESSVPAGPYLILLTGSDRPEDIVTGLDGGADDYITKPFSWDELGARLRIAVRTVGLQQRLADRIAELQSALARVRELSGLLPICSYCKSIRDDQNYWRQLEQYLLEHSDVRFSHGICPKCYERLLPEFSDPPGK